MSIKPITNHQSCLDLLCPLLSDSFMIPREGSAQELVKSVLAHIRRVLRLQVILCNTLQGPGGIQLVWEGAQMEIQALLSRLLGTSAGGIMGNAPQATTARNDDAGGCEPHSCSHACHAPRPFQTDHCPPPFDTSALNQKQKFNLFLQAARMAQLSFFRCPKQQRESWTPTKRRDPAVRAKSSMRVCQ